MEHWSLNGLEIETINLQTSEDLIEELAVPVYQRSGFHYNNEIVTVPRYFYRFIGNHQSEKDYYKEVESYISAIKKLGNLGLCITDGFDRNIPEKLESKFELAWDRITLLSDIQPDMVVRILNTHEMFVEFPNRVLQKQFQSNFEGLLGYYFDVNQEFIQKDEFKKIVLFCIHWLHFYGKTMCMEFDYTFCNPKVFYFGVITKEEIFFLIYLSSLGFDIVYMNPQSECDFMTLDPQNIFSFEKVSYQRTPIRSLQHSQTNDRAETLAYQSSIEIDNMLQDANSIAFKAWQCMDCEVETKTLKTTFEEIFILWKQPAMLRSHWLYEDTRVVIPNLFAKVVGSLYDTEQYIKQVKSVSDAPHTVFVDTFPFVNANDTFAPYFFDVAYETEGKWFIEPKRLQQAKWWPYRHLRSGFQYVLANKISDLVCRPRVMDPFGRLQSQELSQTIFTVLCSLDKQYQDLIQSFDYPHEVPKLLIYNDGQSGEVSLEDSILITFLNAIGFDVLLFNPSGYNDIEPYIYASLFDTHQLEQMVFQFSISFKKQNVHQHKKFGLKNLFSLF